MEARRKRRRPSPSVGWLPPKYPSRPTKLTSSVLLVAILSCLIWNPTRALMDSTPYRSRLFSKPRSGFSSTTVRRMVLTTPESIIEQASTQNLLDDLIDESVRTSARGPIMMQFNPSSGSIWKRWRGTIFSETWESCVKRMLYAVVILFVFKRFPELKTRLAGFNILWGQLLSVTTFTLTFFVNQSYALWRKCYELSRRLQGRLHDVGLTLAVHAERKPPSSPNDPSTYTAASRQILELVSRYIRLFNVLTYASFTRSHRPMLTPRGMRRLVERGLMTAREREVLVDAEVPATQRHCAVMLWVARVFVEGWQAGHFIGGAGFENQILEKIHVCRAQFGAIGDELAGRMPLAYAHIVQVLVDVVLWMYPFMAISSQMSDSLVVLGTGLLTISYQGLFDLAKQFLDPYDNESYGKGEDPLVVDTLIAETNAGSVRWMNSLEEFPISNQRIKDGELSDYLLPVRGYSVEELDEIEEDRLKRERELQERREREEAERRVAEKKAARLRAFAEAMIPALMPPPSANILTYASLDVVNGAASSVLVAPPGSSFSLSSTTAISNIVGNLISVAGGVPPSLIPRGTTASDEDDLIVIEQRKRKARAAKAEADKREETVDEQRVNGDVVDSDEVDSDEVDNDEVDDDEGDEDEVDDDEVDNDEKGEADGESEDFHDDGVFEVLEDWGPEENYVHTFDSVEPYKDLPWLDEVGPDGQEIRLSQLMADEEWEEEVEAAMEKEQPIRTFEEYSKRIEEIRDATYSELAETQEIMSAVPNADYDGSTNLKESKEIIYDQTMLDGISQLWGSLPGEISDLPSYSEPKVSGESDFSSISQLFGEATPPTPREQAVDSEDGYYEESSSYSSIGALWGGFDEDSEDTDRGGTRLIRENAKNYRDMQNLRDDSDAPRATLPVSDSSDVRLSQILADEVWEEEPEELEETVSVQEYAQQIADILEAEKEEQLETEAILNAPAFAEYVGTLENDETDSMKATNSTLGEDDLAVFEMDVVDEDQLSDVSTWPTDDTATSTEPTALEEDITTEDSVDSAAESSVPHEDAPDDTEPTSEANLNGGSSPEDSSPDAKR